jgi:DNA polymerase (family 10)
MAFGFNAERVRQSVGEIAAAQKKYPQIRILHGIECDILADGVLDLDDETLALLDWVIVSIHSRFEMTAEVATQRALRAVSHPVVHAFGHPTGRMIGTRESVPFDVGAVAEACAARGVALEINAAPDRLDLSDVNARLAREKGAKFVIDTDAHATGHLDLMQWGVWQARRAGLTRRDVLNVMPWADFERHLAWRRELAKTQVAMPAPAAPPPAQARLPLAQEGASAGASKPSPKRPTRARTKA